MAILAMLAHGQDARGTKCVRHTETKIPPIGRIGGAWPRAPFSADIAHDNSRPCPMFRLRQWSTPLGRKGFNGLRSAGSEPTASSFYIFGWVSQKAQARVPVPPVAQPLLAVRKETSRGCIEKCGNSSPQVQNLRLFTVGPRGIAILA